MNNNSRSQQVIYLEVKYKIPWTKEWISSETAITVWDFLSEGAPKNVENDFIRT